MNTIIKFFFFLTLILSIACQRNHAPTIIGINLEQNLNSAGAVHTFVVEAHDEDEDPLAYSWSASSGEFLSPTNEKTVQWRSPMDGEGLTFTMSVAVTDGEHNTSSNFEILLTDAILGGVTGYTYFVNCRIPVPDVSVKIGNTETFTDETGKFFLSDIVAGTDSLIVSKQNFSTEITSVKIPANAVLGHDIEMISIVHTSKVFGTILDQNQQLVAGAQIVFLNPDGSDSRLSATSNSEGVYRIPYVPHGKVRIRVSKPISQEFRYSQVDQEIELMELEHQFDFSLHQTALSGEFTDPRDDQVYPFRTIGDQTWMTMNLAYLPSVNRSTEMSETQSYYYVYGFDGTNVETAKGIDMYRDYGVLYNWAAAKKACPDGWHLPNREEYWTLITVLSPKEGAKMKTTSGWEDRGGGDNSSGFSVFPAGNMTKEGKFGSFRNSAYFHTASENDRSSGLYVLLYSGSDEAWIASESKKAAYSVRCLRD